jgi:glycine oxidase
MRRTPDVLVIGGGVIGCAIARALAGEGRSVVCVDRGALGGEASSAAAGVVAAGSGADPPGPVLSLRRAGLARFPALAAELADETGIDVEWTACGVLGLLLDRADVDAATARLEQRSGLGFRVERLDASALRELEPQANPEAAGALLFPDDGQVTPERLVEALVASARRRGAEMIAGAEVHAVERDGRRIARVRVNAETLSPGTVVLAAGAWSAGVPGVAPNLGVVPSRGQMLAIRPAVPLCRHILTRGDAFLVPRRGGEVLVGATFEDAGFEKAVTPVGLAALANRIAVLAPAGLQAPVLRTWAGLRPHAPGGGPILGRAPETENLILACGHHRIGILCAPPTAAVVAALVSGAPPPFEVTAFLPRAGSGA